MQVKTTEPIAAWDADSVARFAAEGDDILVLAREPLATLDTVVQGARVHEYWSMVSRDTAAREVRYAFGDLRVKSPELAADIVSLVTAFLDQFGVSQAKLRVEITHSQSCPNFHCDDVHVRMVTTYLGPTTEYQYAGEDTTHAAPLNGLVFLKGYKHPTHRGNVHHRSPEVPYAEKRLCVMIDY